MRIRFITLLLLVPMLFCCDKEKENGNKPDDNGNNQEQTTPEPDPYPDLAPQVKDGDVILATNPNVEKFVTSVTYPEHNYNETHILDEAYQPTAPGKDDIPSKYTIRWTPDPSAGDPVVRLWEDDGWSREYVKPDVTNEGDIQYVQITSLRPKANYHFEVKAGEKILTSGSFKTRGHVHQVFFSAVRNSRDLGGWKTKDGKKSVKYRMIYRGGRLQNAELLSRGKRDIVAEGIKAQLDLRGEDDVLSGPPIESFDFCAPVIEEGYIQLLRDDKEKAKQCMQFIMKCVRENKPVYFHCSLGRDRTGTVAMMVLGLLGVDEGEISKEYELTQFAPRGYSVSSGETTKMTRRIDYKGAANYIWSFAGEGGSFADGMQNYLLSIGITQAEINEFRNLMLEDATPDEPYEGDDNNGGDNNGGDNNGGDNNGGDNNGGNETTTGITIDGDLSDWAGVTTALTDKDGPVYAFKATYDEEYIYFYIKRNFHGGLFPAESGNGYFYFCLETDENPETGEKGLINGQYSFPYGIDSWFFAFMFDGSPDEPVITSAPKAGSTSYPTDYINNIKVGGKCNINNEIIELELQAKRSDMLIQKGKTVKIHTWGNKSATNIKDTALKLTIEK